eukprot:COSAG04_NODE_4561_length_2016_cov_126.735524_2_plen_146_part_00
MRRYPLNGGAGASPNEPVFGSSPRSIRKLQGAYSLPDFLPQKSELNQRFCKVRATMLQKPTRVQGVAWLSHVSLCTTQDRMEVFLGMPGAGAKLHADSVSARGISPRALPRADHSRLGFRRSASPSSPCNSQVLAPPPPQSPPPL